MPMPASPRQTDRTLTVRAAAKQVLALGGILAVALVSTASVAAEPKPKIRVVSCDAGSCLLVTGHRASAASAVSINGNPVPVEGKRNWRVRVPVDTVREWSAPLARTITVSVADAETRTDTAIEANLPIGLLGHTENLAMLVVRLK